MNRYLLQLKSKGPAVLVLKKILNDNRDNPYRSDGTENFDAALEVGVKAFQKASRLPETGIVDAATWAALGKTLTPNRFGALTADQALIDLLNGVAPAADAIVGPPVFLIVYGDAGGGEHNAGQLFDWSSTTHLKEVNANSFPGVPSPAGATVKRVHVSTVSELVTEINVGNVKYLAYFGHSWTKYLYIGQANAPDTNLSNEGGPNDTKVSAIPKAKFATEVGVTTYAYESPGGSLFTQDIKLGHGKRQPTNADINFTAFKKTKDTWLIPINGSRGFKKFTP